MTHTPPASPTTDRDAVHARVEAVFARRGRAFPGDRITDDVVYRDGLRLHCDVIATDDAVGTVVFMPGTNGYALLYAELLAGLADAGFNVVAFDPRGHGRSDGRRGSYTFPELLGDFVAVVRHSLDRFGRPVVVAGSSQGGIAAFYVAALGLDGVSAAVCHNVADLADPASTCLTRVPPALGGVGRRLVRLARFAPEIPVPLRAYIDLAHEPVDGVGTALDLIAADPLLVPSVRLKTLASLADTPLPVPVEEIRTPVCIVHGEADRIFPTHYIEDILDRLTCPKQLVRVDGHHYVIVDEVPALLPPVTAWLHERIAGQPTVGAP
jgi:pimeloyl-ACP methyl ester carboxylesterase